MAGDWIKMRGGLFQSPKLIAMAKVLHESREFRDWLTPGGSGPVNGQIVSDHALRCVTGALLTVTWSWSREFGKCVTETLRTERNAALRNCDIGDCFLPHIDIKDLDEIAGAPAVGQAMESVGWAVQSNEPRGVILPKFFLDHNVPLTPAERMRQYRQRKKRYESVTQPLRTQRNKCVTREEKRREENKGSLREPLCPAGKQPDRSADVAAVVKHYRTYHPRALPNVTSKAKEYRQIVDRFKEGYTVADLCEAIDGCHKTPHNLGQNDRGTKYLDLELIVRSASHVNRFIENNRSPPKPPETSDDRPLDTSFKLPGEA